MTRPLLRMLGCCCAVLGLPSLYVDAQGKARFAEIDPATIAIYEDKHFAYFGVWVDHGDELRFEGGREYVGKGIPGFHFQFVEAKLPEVAVPFGLSFSWYGSRGAI